MSKHYYAGTQRIVSRLLGSANQFDNDSYKVDSIKTKQIADLEQLYAKAGMGTPEFEQNTSNPTDTNLTYYYHSDHLGSSTYLTDENGKAYQFLLYLPFGETMAEQRNGAYNTHYKFTGKELDEETGLYYFGARFYDPRVSLWLSVDPLAEKYYNNSPYIYVSQNPINLIDPTGMGEEGAGETWYKKAVEGGFTYRFFQEGEDTTGWTDTGLTNFQYHVKDSSAEYALRPNGEHGYLSQNVDIPDSAIYDTTLGAWLTMDDPGTMTGLHIKGSASTEVGLQAKQGFTILGGGLEIDASAGYQIASTEILWSPETTIINMTGDKKGDRNDYKWSLGGNIAMFGGSVGKEGADFNLSAFKGGVNAKGGYNSIKIASFSTNFGGIIGVKGEAEIMFPTLRPKNPTPYLGIEKDNLQIFQKPILYK